MSIRTELNLRLPNSPGALAGVCQLLSDERVNIVAMTLESGGQLRIVVDNRLNARNDFAASDEALARAKEQPIDATRYRPLLAKLVPPMFAAAER